MAGRHGEEWRTASSSGISPEGSGGGTSGNRSSVTVKDVNVSLAMRALRGTVGLLWLSYVMCELLVLVAARADSSRKVLVQ